MDSNASHADFILPGLKDRSNASEALLYSVVHAYSSLSNRRKLENPLYGFWGPILSCLVDDMPGIVVAPQYNLYVASENDNDPDSSSNTVPDKDAKQKFPDFGLIGLVLANRRSQQIITRMPVSITFQNWPILQVAAWKPFLVVEIKRMAGRHFVELADFNNDLISIMSTATLGAEKEAQVAFDESTHVRPAYTLEKLILIATAGEWWRFRIAEASEFVTLDGLDSFLEGLNKPGNLHQDGRITDLRRTDSEAPLAGTPADVGSSKPPVEKGPTMRWTTFDQADMMEKFRKDHKKTTPKKGAWSKYILYGTPESNQRLFLIHEMLEGMLSDLKPEAQARLDKWKRGYESEDSGGEDPLNFLSGGDE